MSTLIFLSLLSVMLLTSGLAKAEDTREALVPSSFSADLISPGDAPDDVIRNTSIRDSVLGVVNYFLTFLGLIAVIFIIYAGFLMVASQGEEDGPAKGKKIITWAAIGIIIILLSYSIVNFVIFAGTAGGV